MSSEPLVSVVIPFFNADRFIAEAIDSVFAQTYENWELLLVDDGSTDGSTEIALKYVRQRPDKVHYLEHEGHQNRGVSESRNLGIAKARGEFIALLDQDDVWLPDKTERQVDILRKYTDVGLVFSSFILLYENGERQPVLQTIAPGKHAGRTWIKAIIDSSNFKDLANPSTVMLRRQAILEVGGFETTFMLEDAACWVKISLICPVFHDSHFVVLWRQHGESARGKLSLEEGQYAFSYFFFWLLMYVGGSAHNDLIPELRNAIMFRLSCRHIEHCVETEQYGAADKIRRWTEQELTVLTEDAGWDYSTAFLLHVLKIDFQEALRRYDKALENGWDKFWVLYNRGSLHAQLGNKEQALEDLKIAVKLHPEHEGARQVLETLLSDG